MADTPAEDARITKPVSSLVFCCQRVLAANRESIATFGDDIPYRLIKPILQGCSPETLIRLEQETPLLEERTSDLWKEICFRVYPVVVEQVLNSDREEPGSWRDEFFSIKEKEAKRFEEAASKIRNQRIEAEDLKRKRQVKLTDRVPPPKRSRSGWCTGPIPSKTLFEKTRKEATKMQKSVFGSRSLPPTAGNSRAFRAKISAPSAQLASKRSDPVLINTITVRNPCTNSPLSTSQTLRSSEPLTRSSSSEPNRRRTDSVSDTNSHYSPTRAIPVTLPKKDPVSTLFLPKQRTPSQVASMATISSKFSAR